MFALVNNIIEIRLDGNKILCSTRRCVPDRAEDIGTYSFSRILVIILSSEKKIFYFYLFLSDKQDFNVYIS